MHKLNDNMIVIICQQSQPFLSSSNIPNFSQFEILSGILLAVGSNMWEHHLHRQQAKSANKFHPSHSVWGVVWYWRSWLYGRYSCLHLWLSREIWLSFFWSGSCLLLWSKFFLVSFSFSALFFLSICLKDNSYLPLGVLDILNHMLLFPCCCVWWHRQWCNAVLSLARLKSFTIIRIFSYWHFPDKAIKVCLLLSCMPLHSWITKSCSLPL